MHDSDVDPDAIWDETLAILRRDDAVNDRVMAFLTLSRLVAIPRDTALVAAPNTMAKDLFETRVAGPLRDALTQATGRDTRFAVVIDPDLLTRSDDEDESSAGETGRRTPTVDHGVDNSGDAGARTSAPIPEAPTASPSGGLPETGPIDRDPEAPLSDILPPPSTGAAGIGRGGSLPSSTEPSAEATAELGVGPGGSRHLPAVPPRREDHDHPDDETIDGSTTLGSDSRLNGKYTFDTFVIGSSNRFAQAAASAVSEAPAKAYNPLFIYGGSGLGKTHLLHAVGHYAQSLYAGIEVRYVNSEEFTNDFINSVQSGQFGKAQEFHRRYRDIDILLIDDIQFLQRAPETMEAFFHTFNTLHNADKQIVITSDLPPKQLGGFEDRMRSRFEMGLMTDVQPPDLETRIAILRKKVEMEGQKEVPRDVLEYIASRISTNIRELEGALIRVQALHSLSRQPMDVSLAENVLKDLLAHDDGAEITASTIIAQTASYFGLTVDQITGGARTRVLVTARQIAMYLCRELTDMPLMSIGKEFGGRDHTTVMHANKKISELMKERRAIFNQVTELTARIKNSSSQQNRR
ncbi:MAG: chromosomal replication initiator protein DnaA [Brachybacterium sp.]|nr:chromosomal replication initiator protein DnaA [Brachybacterium sp.]